jgi:hypothetical protein
MGTISGSVHVRPVRVGFVATSHADGLVTQAAGLATSAWGGKYFPILDATTPETRQISERLSIDIWHPLDEERETVESCDQPGFSWQGGLNWGPFRTPDVGYSSRLLGPEDLLRSDTARRALVRWDSRDELASLYEAWFGIYKDDEYGRSQATKFTRDAEVLELAVGQDRQSQISLVRLRQ